MITQEMQSLFDGLRRELVAIRTELAMIRYDVEQLRNEPRTPTQNYQAPVEEETYSGVPADRVYR